jgi:hypothetical protein
MKQAPLRPESYTKKVALVLQGGGALGSYQAGVYEALASSNYEPDWVAGISIGAINAALIAGNSSETRVEKLREFWRAITTPARWVVPISQLFNVADPPFELAKQISAMNALLLGQTNFFAPRKPADWWFGRTPTSYYDTNSLKSTLERHVDFDRINSKEIRFSVGAVNVRTGNFVYFDNAEIEIRPEHVLASGALPPGFPSVEIDGEHYGHLACDPCANVATKLRCLGLCKVEMSLGGLAISSERRRPRRGVCDFDLAASAIREARFFRSPDAWLERRGPFGMVLRRGCRSCCSLIQARISPRRLFSTMAA